MEIIRIPRLMQDMAFKERMRGKSLGFVPTMGSLHEGHMSLARVCREENDMAVVSIFVNPAQFGPSEDYKNYPRDTEADMEALRPLGIDVLFLPEASSIYPNGFSTTVRVGEISEKLCGRFRPGHFDGVATVVAKLLNIVFPQRAYFGAKDYQQTLIVKKLVRDLNMPVEVVLCHTVREADGLAMSSRNSYLSSDERKAASAVFRALSRAKEQISSGITDVVEIKRSMHEALSGPLIKEIQYASVYDPETLDELSDVKKEALIAAAVRIGCTRLIDNMLVNVR
jgi:pantoate--beta-alanine ligase